MRYIDINEVALPDGWEAEADEAKNVIEETNPEDRSKEIKRRNGVWGDLKQPLADLSHEKCWYCESRRVRDDYAVDHFRPKSARVKDDHNGYWWLAFDFRNFRFSCKYCNEVRIDPETEHRGGKGSSFPLLEGGVRACCPEDNLDNERCALLDPSKDGEAQLLGFQEDGIAVSEADPDLEPDAHQRGHITVTTLNLNHSWLLKRRAQTATTVARLVAGAQLEFEKCLERRREDNYAAIGDAKGRFQTIIRELNQLKGEEAEYSALSAAILKSKRRPERPWMDRLFQ